MSDYATVMETRDGKDARGGSVRSPGALRALGFAQGCKKGAVLPGASREEMWCVLRAEPSLC